VIKPLRRGQILRIQNRLKDSARSHRDNSGTATSNEKAMRSGWRPARNASRCGAAGR
jgi:hypothetical protein